MESERQLFNLLGLNSDNDNEDDTETGNGRAAVIRSAHQSRQVVQQNLSDGIFRSESTSARFHLLMEWNRSEQTSRPTANQSFNQTTSSSSALFGGLRNQTPSVFSSFFNQQPTTSSSGRLSRRPTETPSVLGSIFNPNYSVVSSRTNTSDPHRSAVIVAIVEGRGQAKGTIGLAAIDLYNPPLVLSQFNDGTNYELLLTKLEILQPVCVLIPKTFFSNDSNHLVQVLQAFISANLPNCVIKDFERRHFNESEGLDQVKKLRCDESPSLMIQLQSKYYCLASCAAVLKYIEIFEHLVYAPKSLGIEFEVPEEFLTIDPTTAKLLELIYNLNDSKSGHSLFATINKTKTRGGHRLLRSSILQPSTDQKLIESRLDMVQEIISSEPLFTEVEGILTQLMSIEIERIISVIILNYKPEEKNVKTAERKIETIIVLKHILTLVEPLKQALSQTTSQHFKHLIDLLSDQRFEMIIGAINEMIEDSCKYTKGGLNMTLEKCHAIKKGQNALLDLARDTYSESIDDISHMVDGYRQKHDLPMRVAHTAGRGYHIEMRFKDKDRPSQLRLPQLFVRVVHKKSSIICTTWDLINKNNRINASIEEIYLISDAIANTFFEEIRQYIGCLYNLSEAVSKLDIVYAFASQCAIGNYVRPEFGHYNALKGSRHPILERVLNAVPVPNDLYITEEHNFHVITGPNMSGKSTLLKQVALLQVMAQIGSYIPADYAKFRICDKLFSRIGNNDEIETNSSTFQVEMREMSYILHKITNKSLIIIDELGRGTCPEEAVALCFAIAEELIKSKAFTLFATHFLELTSLENYFYSVTNYTFRMEKTESEESEEPIADENDALRGFTHKLEEGVTDEPLYGIRIAKCTDMDPEIIAEAEVLAIQLKQNQNRPVNVGHITPVKRLYYKLGSLLKTFAKEKRFDEPEMLTQMQKHFGEEIRKAQMAEMELGSSSSSSDMTLD